mmetsp:Transcript_17975/g.63501  ORF Transcript_17975/g.63501 Transcript_17975/m.63501 type:complete len:502 (-) Transcript_17975:470-1975(-)
MREPAAAALSGDVSRAARTAPSPPRLLNPKRPRSGAARAADLDVASALAFLRCLGDGSPSDMPSSVGGALPSLSVPICRRREFTWRTTSLSCSSFASTSRSTCFSSLSASRRFIASRFAVAWPAFCRRFSSFSSIVMRHSMASRSSANCFFSLRIWRSVSVKLPPSPFSRPSMRRTLLVSFSDCSCNLRHLCEMAKWRPSASRTSDSMSRHSELYRRICACSSSARCFCASSAPSSMPPSCSDLTDCSERFSSCTSVNSVSMTLISPSRSLMRPTRLPSDDASSCSRIFSFSAPIFSTCLRTDDNDFSVDLSFFASSRDSLASAESSFSALLASSLSFCFFARRAASALSLALATLRFARRTSSRRSICSRFSSSMSASFSALTALAPPAPPPAPTASPPTSDAPPPTVVTVASVPPDDWRVTRFVVRVVLVTVTVRLDTRTTPPSSEISSATVAAVTPSASRTSSADDRALRFGAIITLSASASATSPSSWSDSASKSSP